MSTCIMSLISRIFEVTSPRLSETNIHTIHSITPVFTEELGGGGGDTLKGGVGFVRSCSSFQSLPLGAEADCRCSFAVGV